MYTLLQRAYPRLCATAQTTSGFKFILINGERWISSTALRAIVNRHQDSIMNKDQAKGRFEQAKGKMKEVVGKVFGKKDLEQKGKLQNTGGKIQAGYGDVKDDIKTSI